MSTEDCGGILAGWNRRGRVEIVEDSHVLIGGRKTPELGLLREDEAGLISWVSPELRKITFRVAARTGWFASRKLLAKVLLLLFAWPFLGVYGLYWMWRLKRFTEIERILITVVSVALFAAGIISGGARDRRISQPSERPTAGAHSASGQPTESPTPDMSSAPPSAAQPSKASVSYRIVKYEDVGLKRIRARVVIADFPDKEQFVDLAKRARSQVRIYADYSAAFIAFHLEGEEVDQAPSVGFVEDAPKGVWEDANQLGAGKYETFKMKAVLVDKEGLEKPSQQQLDLAKAWQIAYEEAESQGGDIETKAAQAVAERFDVLPAEVLAARILVDNWNIGGKSSTFLIED